MVYKRLTTIPWCSSLGSVRKPCKMWDTCHSAFYRAVIADTVSEMLIIAIRNGQRLINRWHRRTAISGHTGVSRSLSPCRHRKARTIGSARDPDFRRGDGGFRADGGFRGQRVCRDSGDSRGNEGSRLIGTVLMTGPEVQRQCPLCAIPPQDMLRHTLASRCLRQCLLRKA